ncbi:L-lactate dehydrogenase [Bradyrhizobium diazoefficiens USDA 110]|uniref:Putative L-lactate dehydrogenase n=2 Tax=Bradyrhizobium diazoefficiens TaxID=1355477 RepID=Q89GE4_BRADU|nr:lactate dehydrogenase [Bradyrhizobium diazoefficiens]BAC51666.1 L-lactate dehydrogenase [Bradyrhizobium diazoefficiens USDA 110]
MCLLRTMWGFPYDKNGVARGLTVTPVCIDDYRSLAKRRLPRMVFDYLDGGAESERSLHRNLGAFAAINFAPRRLVDVSHRNSSVSLFGRTLPTPFVVAPTGLNGALWPDGDVALARAARSAGIPFVLSTASNATIEDVAERAGGDLWFQLYVVQRDLARLLVGRAKEAGYRVLVLTVDVAVNGKRDRDLRNGFAIPFRQTPRSVLDAVTHPRWALGQIRHGLPQLANFASPDATDVNAQAALMRRQMDASFCWQDLQALRDAWPGRLIVKGIMTATDVNRCRELGVDAVVLSNHGGRQIEDVQAPIDLLAEISNQNAMPLLVDGGIRRGADAVKALALGAKAVLLGRAILYGLAAAGEEGAGHVLQILTAEFDTTLALVGCPDPARLNRQFIQL